MPNHTPPQVPALEALLRTQTDPTKRDFLIRGIGLLYEAQLRREGGPS
jgi:hypothetical protein